MEAVREESKDKNHITYDFDLPFSGRKVFLSSDSTIHCFLSTFGDVLLFNNPKAIPYFPCTLGKGSVIVRAWLTAMLSQDSI